MISDEVFWKKNWMISTLAALGINRVMGPMDFDDAGGVVVFTVGVIYVVKHN